MKSSEGTFGKLQPMFVHIMRMNSDLTAELSHLKDFPMQKEILSKAMALLFPDDRVLGVIVAGSIVQGVLDEYLL